MKDKIIEEIELVGAESWVSTHPNSKNKIKALMKMYATAYYEGNALITDMEFENLIDALKIYDINDTYLTTPGWGYEIENGIDHIYGVIGSLPYYFDYNQIKEIVKDVDDWMITPKLDGINFVAYYKDGKFERCVTRGNGRVGKDISWAYVENQILPEYLQNKTFALNGEAIYLNKDNESIHSRDYVSIYLQEEKSIDSQIKFVPFGVLNSDMDYFEQITEINKMITPKIDYQIFKKLPSANELRCLFEEYGKMFPVDGLVITNKTKEIQIAYKFKD